MKTSVEYKASVVLFQYCPPVLLTFGTFGNLMTIIILRRMKMKRSAMPIYLTALAVSDTSLLYTGLLRYWILNVFDLDVRTLHPAMCKVHTWLVYTLTIISAWILTFMTVERTLSVCVPHRVSSVCTRAKAKVIVLGVVVSSLALNSHLLYGLDVTVSGNGTCTCFSPDPDYLHFFNTVWSWVDLTMASLIPFTVLLVGNTLILSKIYSSVRSARYLGSVRGGHDIVHRRKTMSSMTVTLVALNVVFFLTTSPICVYNIIEHYIEGDKQDAVHGPGEIRLAWAVVNILLYINNTVNFYLYSLSGSNFRKELRKFLCCQPTPPASFKNGEHLQMNNHFGPNHHDMDQDDHRRLPPIPNVQPIHEDGHYQSGHVGDDKDVPDSLSLKSRSRTLCPADVPLMDSSSDF